MKMKQRKPIKIIPSIDYPDRQPREFYPHKDTLQYAKKKVNKSVPHWNVFETHYAKIKSELSEDIARKSIRIDLEGKPWNMERYLHEICNLFGADVAWQLGGEDFSGYRQYAIWRGQTFCTDCGLIDSVDIGNMTIAFNINRVSQYLGEPTLNKDVLKNYWNGALNLREQGIETYGCDNSIQVTAQGKNIEACVRDMIFKTYELASQKEANLIYMRCLEMPNPTVITGTMEFYFSEKRIKQQPLTLPEKYLKK